MSGVIRNQPTAAFQGFSISQPFLGASLQFYPEMGTQELDDLVNAYLPGSASIQEKRATVSMDFFAFSQLTGETFKYYPVASDSSSSAVSSAGSSPMQNSSSSSNFVSPVISDWSWSQSTPSSASASTPTSVSQESVYSKSSRRAASSATKPQANDFSHLPGMKIMTKDGRDVTNSASRGCKTKEQRDHAHLMRIIKACDACKKKKVRCDPSHKKRTTTQAQGIAAAPARSAKKKARSAKKAKTSKRDSPVAAERSPQPSTSFSTPALFTESSFADLDMLNMVDSWESLVQFDDEPANVAPFEYDFFFDPAGHLTPESSQSPITPSMVFSQSQNGFDGLQNVVASKPFPDELDVRPPALPYLDSSPRISNYVDFSLYSPEPSFLDDDVALLSDIGTTTTKAQNTLSQRRSSPQSGQSSVQQQVHLGRSPTAPDDYSADDSGVPTESESQLSLSDVNATTSRSVRSQRLADTALQPSSLQLLPLPHATSRSAVDLSGVHATPLGGVLPGVVGRVPTSSVIASSRSSTAVEEASYYAHITRTSNDANGRRAIISGVSSSVSSDAQHHLATSESSEIRHITTPSATRSSAGVFVLGGVQVVMEAVAGGSLTCKRRSLIDWLSKSQCLVYVALFATAFCLVAQAVEVHALASRFIQLAVGLAIYKVYHSYSSLYDSRPEQSHLGTATSKPQGLSDGARLLSCVSTRLRRTCRQTQSAQTPVNGARMRVLSLAQGLS
ncbi:hypothetical protein CaCOL14_007909 [Colletotrichum acutatum]